MAQPMEIPKSETYEKDGFTMHIDYKINGEGKLVKITKKVLQKKIKEKVHKSVLERKNWKKFGSALLEGNSLTVKEGDAVFLKLSSYLNVVEETNFAETLKKMAVTKNITCRYCNGEHFSHACQFKDQANILEGPSKPVTPVAKEVNTGKYVAPHLRGERRNHSTETSTEEVNTTIRVSNLPPETIEDDIRRLFSPFGPLSRVFLSKDYNTKLCKGFAFVKFESKNDASKAIQVVNGYGYNSLILKVEWSESK